MEYVEVARAESERGEVVLRRRTDDNAVDVLELRVNGVFVMDTLETSTEHALAEAALAQVGRPARRAGRRARARLHHARGARGPRGSRRSWWSRSRSALIDWMRDGTMPHGPAFLADDAADDRRPPTSRWRSPEADPGGYDLVLLDVDNGPGYLVHDSNAAPLRARVPGRACDARCAPAASSRSGRPTESPDAARPRWRRCSATCTALTVRRATSRTATEQYWLYLSATLSHRLPLARIAGP